MDNTLTSTSASISNLGPLSDLCWPGKISARLLIEEGVAHEDQIKDLIKNINNYYHPTNVAAKTRCIDGRFDPDFELSGLGPQVPGGSVGATLAYKLSAGRSSLVDSNFSDDAEQMFKTFEKLNITPGAHRDEHADGISAVGCGAIDKMNLAVDLLSDKQYVKAIYELSKAMIGESFKDDNFYNVIGSAVTLNAHSSDYFGNRLLSFDTLEKKVKNSVTTLLGNHQECIVVANYVSDTTLAENVLLEDYNGIQVFNYDVWRTLDLAAKLFPAKSQANDKDLFIMARAMTAVATLMCLTDGSQTLLIRS